jgi:hypothetical protein
VPRRHSGPKPVRIDLPFGGEAIFTRGNAEHLAVEGLERVRLERALREHGIEGLRKELCKGIVVGDRPEPVTPLAMEVLAEASIVALNNRVDREKDPSVRKITKREVARAAACRMARSEDELRSAGGVPSVREARRRMGRDTFDRAVATIEKLFQPEGDADAGGRRTKGEPVGAAGRGARKCSPTLVRMLNEIVGRARRQGRLRLPKREPRTREIIAGLLGVSEETVARALGHRKP